ncbi:MAG: hypothetical protein AB1750_07790 [Chloroflexota bacterium]
MKREAILAYTLPRVQDFVFILILLLGVTLGPRFLGDGDPGRHIVVGKIILTEGEIPRTDIFSQTKPGQPLTTTEWLSEVVYAAAYLALGLDGVVALAIALIAVTFTLVFRETLRVSDSYALSFALVFLMIAATLFHWLARPHLFSWLMLAIWLSQMDRLARGETKNIWQFPLMMLLWANLHGGFIVGLLVWAAYAAGSWFDKPAREVWKRVWLAGAASLAATFVNPSGAGLWGNVVGHVGDSALMALQIDWRSPDFHSANAWPFLFILGLLLLSRARADRPLSGGQSFLLAGLTAFALVSVRNIPFFVIACVPLLGYSLPRLKLDSILRATQSWLRGAVWPVAAALIVVGLTRSGVRLDAGRMGNTFDPARFPVGAADWLEVHPQEGNVFNEFTWGGYLLFRLWPDQRVFIDGQTDFYGAELSQDYLTMYAARENWEALLAEYQIDWAILPRSSPLAQELRDAARWRVLYEDETAVILRK